MSGREKEALGNPSVAQPGAGTLGQAGGLCLWGFCPAPTGGAKPLCVCTALAAVSLLQLTRRETLLGQSGVFKLWFSLQQWLCHSVLSV